jgi:hypothetical protein
MVAGLVVWMDYFSVVLTVVGKAALMVSWKAEKKAAEMG